MKTLKKTLLSVIFCMLLVVVPFSVNAHALSKMTMKVAQKQTLVYNRNGVKVNASWSTSNKSVASVTKSGVVSAKKPGKCVITARYKGKALRVTVTVKANQLSTKKLNTYNWGLDNGYLDYKPTVCKYNSDGSMTVTFKIRNNDTYYSSIYFYDATVYVKYGSTTIAAVKKSYSSKKSVKRGATAYKLTIKIPKKYVNEVVDLTKITPTFYLSCY